MSENHTKEEHEAQQSVPNWIIQVGLPQHYWPQLIEYTRTDPDIAKFTSDSQRFATNDTIKQWLKGNRAIYTATDIENTTLLGISWFGPKEVPMEEFELLEPIDPTAYPLTQARRVYGPLRGTRSSTAVFINTLHQFQEHPLFTSSHGGFWTETSNPKILNANTRFGYRVASKQNEKGKVLLLGERGHVVDSVTEYMKSLSVNPNASDS